MQSFKMSIDWSSF